MSSQTSWLSAGTVVSFDHDSDGGRSWTSPTNAQGAADGTGATMAQTGASGGGITNAYLKATNFGFTSTDVPVGATILGIEVRVTRKKTTTGGTTQHDLAAKLVKAGSLAGNNNADVSTDWPTTYTQKVYGTSADLWGLALTESDVISATFGFGFQVGFPGGITSCTSDVDSIEMRITYSVGQPAPNKATNACLIL